MPARFPQTSEYGMNEAPATLQTCMCIDLDPDFYYLMQTYAERSGLRAVQSNRGQDVLELVRRQKPAVVFLEGDGPGAISAWEVLKAIKAEGSTANIPVVLFSWVNEEEHAIEAGADVYVQKPVMYVDFMDALAVAGIRQDGTGGTQSDTGPSHAKGGALPQPEG